MPLTAFIMYVTWQLRVNGKLLSILMSFDLTSSNFYFINNLLTSNFLYFYLFRPFCTRRIFV